MRLMDSQKEFQDSLGFEGGTGLPAPMIRDCQYFERAPSYASLKRGPLLTRGAVIYGKVGTGKTSFKL